MSPRFFLFSLVGASGVAVHLLALRFVLGVPGFDFNIAQIAASYVAMTWNFFLNNAMTYRDCRLTGFAALRGLLTFYLVCSVGMLANVGVAQLVFRTRCKLVEGGPRRCVAGRSVQLCRELGVDMAPPVSGGRCGR